ncbi:RNA polymerase sigma factor [Flavipsychrobacter stenotrophus]|nr:sigma-70 family RNA polymerase sigma factor [Flavipsychrobacter stenotrophus]
MNSDRHSKLSDEELLQAYRKTSDNMWLGHLLQRYTTLLLGVAMKYLKDRTLAEDAVQQVFLKALTHMPKEEITNFKGWLYILTRNHCLQSLRDKTYNTDTDALHGLASPVVDNEEIRLQEYTLQQMNEGILLLNEEQRVTITLFYLRKKSYEQITAQTGFTYMQVKSFIQNGKRNLKSILLKKLGARDI